MHERDAEEILRMERDALRRWCSGDPDGFLEISAPDVVYFDPFLDERIDGRDALARYYDGLRGKVNVTRYEMIAPCVQFAGDAAVLTFRFDSFGGAGDAYRWNCTEVYRRDGTVPGEARWRIVQTHWSFTRGRRG